MVKKALIFDDDVLSLNILEAYFADRGVQAETYLAPTCPLLEQNSTECPLDAPACDVLLTDNRMPHMTGIEFIAYTQQRGCKIPPRHIALISGDLSHAERRWAEKSNIRTFDKPCPLEYIDNWLNSLDC